MKHKTLWISVAAFASLAIIFAFTDLLISRAIANPSSDWARLLEAYGQLPGALVGFLGGGVLLRLTKLEKSFKSIGSVILFFILTAFMGLGFWADMLGQQTGAKVNFLFALALAINSLVLVQVWFRLLPEEIMQKYKPFAQVAVPLFFIAGFITVWTIKIPWGRWTYRDMLEIGDFSLFTPWYLPQGNNGHHSFISGHTSIAFCVLPVVLLFRKSETQLAIAWVLVMFWGVANALSRVVIGAHFPSDVLFGAGQTLLWFYILSRKVIRA